MVVKNVILKGGAIIQLRDRVRFVERLSWGKPYVQSFAYHRSLKAFTLSAVQTLQVSKWVRSEKYGFREKQLQPNAPATVSQRWKPAHFYWFAKMHAGKLPSAPCNFALHIHNFTFLHISKSYSPLPLLQPSSMSARLILFRKGARKAPNCGWKSWTDWLVKMIPLQKAAWTVSLTPPTQSNKTSAGEGVFMCVFRHVKVKNSIKQRSFQRNVNRAESLS